MRAHYQRNWRAPLERWGIRLPEGDERSQKRERGFAARHARGAPPHSLMVRVAVSRRSSRAEASVRGETCKIRLVQ
jgi:hypothetical protein